MLHCVTVNVALIFQWTVVPFLFLRLVKSEDAGIKILSNIRLPVQRQPNISEDLYLQ